jgi:hypothetical protein
VLVAGAIAEGWPGAVAVLWAVLPAGSGVAGDMVAGGLVGLVVVLLPWAKAGAAASARMEAVASNFFIDRSPD